MSRTGTDVELLKIGELAEASEVPVPTIKHYLREGLLPEPVKTSRNMAYYPPEFVDRIKLIKQLQEERFMPLKAIKSVLDEDPERARALVELEDRILERALGSERTRTSAAEDAILSTSWEGLPLTRDHGGPMRLVVPHLYFWKSAKWLRRIDLMPSDKAGFWEKNGYHMYGDPWREQRYSED